MRIKVHTGSIPVSAIDRIAAEMLIAVDGSSESDPVFKEVFDLTGCNAGVPFAKTLTGIDVLDTRECSFPANRYGVRFPISQLLGDGGDANMDGIMKVAAGLGVESLLFFTFSPVQYHSQEQDMLTKIADWLRANDSTLTDIYVLSNAVGNTKECSCGRLLADHPEYNKVIIDAGCVGKVASKDGWWYFTECGKGGAKIVHVIRNSEFLHNRVRLSVPERLEGLRVVAIDDNAFVQSSLDRLLVEGGADEWQDILEELTIPRYVSHMNVAHILDTLPALKRVNVDPQNHFFEMGEPFLVRKINGEHE